MMTPEPALWNGCSRGCTSGGVSKKRRKKGSSISGLRCPWSLIVPRVAILTTAGETRLTIGASEGIGAASSVCAAGAATDSDRAAGRVSVAAASAAASETKRRVICSPLKALSTQRGRTPVSRSSPGFYTQARRLRRASGSLNHYALRLYLRELRNRNLQHPVRGLGPDVLRIHALRQTEAALEVALDALHAAIACAFRLGKLGTLAADREHALLGGDLNGFRIHARDIDMQQ